MNQDLFQQASDYRRLKKYKACVQILRPLWDEDPMSFDEWNTWDYAYSLKELQQYEEALDICRLAYPRFSESRFISNLYAQCIFYTQFRTSQDKKDINILRKALDGMYKLSPPYEPYSFTSIASFRYCKELMKLNPIPWGEIESVLLRMEPELLNKDTFKIKQPNGRTTELASQYEEWYSMMIRVKAGRSDVQELLKIIEEAKSKNIKWHYNNDIWIKRKEAFAYHQLGQSEKAEQLLLEILRFKKDWFLYSDLGDVQTDPKQKLKSWSKAALQRGKLEMKINLFGKIANLIEIDSSLKAIYQSHLILMLRIYLENGWNIPAKLEEKLNHHAVDISAVNNAKEAYARLKTYWQENVGEEKHKKKGGIAYLHNNGKSGIIKGDDGIDYFFSLRNYRGDVKDLQVGHRFSFSYKKSFDRKKNKDSWMAYELTLIK